MSEISINGAVLNVSVLPREDFFRMTGALCARGAPAEASAFEAFIAEKRQAEQQLREALGRRWREHRDFEVGRDTNLAYTMCGGVYDPSVLCHEYLRILRGVLEATRFRDEWSYATAVELAEARDGVTDVDFVLTRGEILVCAEAVEVPFVRWFSQGRVE